MKKIAILFIVLVIASTFAFLYYHEGGLPVNKSNNLAKIFVIRSGESIPTIAKNLENEGLIRNKIIFYLTVKELNIAQNIQAGDFRLSPSMSAHEIAQNLTKGTLDTWVTIIEGLRKEEIAQTFSREFNIPEIAFVKEAHEGYLFPDTYLIPKDATLGAILAIFQKNFDNKYTPLIAQKITGLGLTQDQGITIASIVEKETIHDADKQQVAGIILKRYNSHYPLQVDPSVAYALGYQEAEKSWWKKELTLDDLKIDSPYNTYKNTGLPPGAIDSPGLASILAVANATINTPYFYYISDKSGNMHYAKTLEEHNANVKKYLTQ